ncbi:MAG: bifunctional folylpolyglutamate synthase/dihydrofolate synthase [Bryobacteraceae bacterium]|nr:bifunctional folylpolyglutamate synthase/dihydrofolate synthase [Bryobacteraceae bacterium]
MTYPDSVRFLYELGNEIRTAKLGLDRMRALLGELGHPERACRYVHVAGTNGKGSTCAMVESGLRAAGVRTGLYTSPHLITPTERIRIAGEEVSEERFAWAFEIAHRTAEEMLRREELDAHPTYFETLTAMAFLLFREAGVETVVLEVGLGGRLDATNVVDPLLTAITPVDFDHESHLGNALRTIAREKAGILKPGVPAVFARQRPEAMEALEERAAELGIPTARTEDWRIGGLEIDKFGHRCLASGPGRTIRIECPLAGEHQVENSVTAAAILAALGIPNEAIERGIRQVRWPGRLERVSERPEVLLDGAHNPAGIRALAAHLRRFYRDRRLFLIYGSMRDKSVDEIAGVLSPLAHRIILAPLETQRAVRPEALLRFFPDERAEVAPGVGQALALARSAARDEDVIVITGSLMLVGKASELLANRMIQADA